MLGLSPARGAPALRRHHRLRRAARVHRPQAQELLERHDGPPRVQRDDPGRRRHPADRRGARGRRRRLPAEVLRGVRADQALRHDGRCSSRTTWARSSASATARCCSSTARWPSSAIPQHVGNRYLRAELQPPRRARGRRPTAAETRRAGPRSATAGRDRRGVVRGRARRARRVPRVRPAGHVRRCGCASRPTSTTRLFGVALIDDREPHGRRRHDAGTPTRRARALRGRRGGHVCASRFDNVLGPGPLRADAGRRQGRRRGWTSCDRPRASAATVVVAATTSSGGARRAAARDRARSAARARARRPRRERRRRRRRRHPGRRIKGPAGARQRPPPAAGTWPGRWPSPTSSCGSSARRWATCGSSCAR